MSLTNKRFIAASLALAFSGLLLVMPVPARAATTCAQLQTQFNQLGPGPEADALIAKFPKHCSAVQALSKAITIALSVAAAASVIAIMYGGFVMITSAGNEERFGQGKKALTAAIIGFVVIILAGLIVTLVSNVIIKGTAL